MISLPPFQRNKSLREVSTFYIGGPARLFVEVTSIEEMQTVLKHCNEEKISFFILGKGSNCLFDDRGFDGLVIQNKISYFQIKGLEVEVGAGYSFSMLGLKTAKQGLSGLEFASGIPATVGGAIFMNAGANGQETFNTLSEVLFIDETGNLHSYKKKELAFRYRFSSFQEKKGAIVGAKFCLTSSEEARNKQLSIIDYRTKTQPYNQPSIGCIFKNPEGASAGGLIEKSGLKGFCIGDAEVSLKHANFIVNRREALAKDVLALARHVQETVKEETGVDLEMEVRCIPYQITP
jgi:UDP-N-acetylmuramate dehydrogenase